MKIRQKFVNNLTNEFVIRHFPVDELVFVTILAAGSHSLSQLSTVLQDPPAVRQVCVCSSLLLSSSQLSQEKKKKNEAIKHLI